MGHFAWPIPDKKTLIWRYLGTKLFCRMFHELRNIFTNLSLNFMLVIFECIFRQELFSIQIYKRYPDKEDKIINEHIKYYGH